MRQIVISDLHLGDPYGCDLLREPWARERLWPLLDGVDRLVLLGDVWEMTFQAYEQAVDASRAFFRELERLHPGLRVLVIPGNHDHNLVSRAADEARERRALRLDMPPAFRVPPAERIIRALAPGLRVESAYPAAVSDGVWLHHGHYLSTHDEDALWRALDRAGWALWGKPRRTDGLQAADYEALIVPLYEMVHQIAQLPDGTASQQQIELTLQRWVKPIALTGRVGGQAVGLARSVARRARRHPAIIEERPPPTMTGLRAIGEVAQNLDVASIADRVVFGHTHEPLFEQHAPDERVHEMTFTNTGSWFLDHRLARQHDYRERHWPGTAVILQDGKPALVSVMDDLDLDAILELHQPRLPPRSGQRCGR